MRYFEYKLLAKANGWNGESEAVRTRAGKVVSLRYEDYLSDLVKLESRISKVAFRFFSRGYGSAGLHDARLVKMEAGDGINFSLDGSKPFRINKQKCLVVLEFLNFDQDRHYCFSLKGVNRLQVDLKCDSDNPGAIGDLYAYELTGSDERYLELGFLFSSGSEIVVRFQKFVFRKKRLTRDFEFEKVFK